MKTARLLRKKRDSSFLQNRPYLSLSLSNDKDKNTQAIQKRRREEEGSQKLPKISYALGLLSLSPPPPKRGRRNSRILRFSLERTRTTLEWMAAEMQ